MGSNFERGSATRPNPLRVAADVDTGIDDALALVYLAAVCPDLRVTTSAGNCSAVAAARNSRAVLDLCHSFRTPITPGAPRPLLHHLTTTPETHGPDGLGYYRTTVATPSVGCAAEAVAAWESPEGLLVSGPATNLAWAVQQAGGVPAPPGFPARTVIMGGAFDYPGNTTATAEWNVWVDPHSLDVTLRQWPAGAALPLICPLNVTEQVILDPRRLAEWIEVLQARGLAELGTLLEEALRFYFEFHEHVGVGYCAQIHDLAAAMVLLDAVEYEAKPGYVQVAVDGERRGTTGVDWHATPNAHIVTALNPDGVFQQFQQALDCLGGNAPSPPR
ncbi:nucleoside hydrolase [Corynebacterium heidelbergense]|uniref:Nucleoside hydrolase n=1 Tax=Corynebacterium heidelbergense TaxID=2055947 RepID=A0A364VC61_9CORY|nr:nucleoside hydrolase [Corynebacterium heidelbergense]RAV34214.1 nucleoside hydrolase [Corynebacterium heidelbergense]WCZ35819.1 Pyrimidine-specific ribonucleoside hydrolase RihA [Corynebacterium heidelbergense]